MNYLIEDLTTETKDKLAGWEIALIVIFVLLAFAAGGFAFYYFFFRKHDKPQEMVVLV